MDLKTTITQSLANTALLQPILLALVTLSGKFGAQGKIQLAVSLVSGIILGAFAYIATLGAPADPGGWFAFFIFSLIPGLIASGVYETGVNVVKKYSG